MTSPATPRANFDVVIVGGALSGAATAVLLLSERPDLRVLIVERSAAFTRRVGEATVEISTYFLRHCLGLSNHLSHHHLVKNGLRFWFANDQTQTIADCAEIGGRYLARVPAYLVDRAVLDEEVLRRARELGAEIWRPASVQSAQLHDGGEQELVVKRGETTTEIRARWLVDASGVAALLARQQGWWRANEAHPTTAAWSRWTGVKDLDSPELSRQFPDWAKQCCGIRSTATNHLMGCGWWAWIIPLKDGDVSIGVVFDERTVQWPQGGAPGDRLKEFLLRHPVGRALLADAHWTEGDVHWRRRLPYVSTTFAGDGFALVGDAAGFLDPFYSPGLDWITFTAWRAAQLIFAERRGEVVAPLVARHNAAFTRSYDRWFNAVYRDKYDYFGEFDVMAAAFLMDIGLYYMGVASQPFRRGPEALGEPYFALPPSTPFYHWMRAYNRRFAAIARARRERGVAGARNFRRRLIISGFSFEPGTVRPIAKGLVRWAGLELMEGWRSWFRSERQVAAPFVAAERSAVLRGKE